MFSENNSNKESEESDESTSGGSDKIMTHTKNPDRNSKNKYKSRSNSSQTSFNSETYSGSRSNGHVRHDEGQHLGYGLDGGQTNGGFGHEHGLTGLRSCGGCDGEPHGLGGCGGASRGFGHGCGLPGLGMLVVIILSRAKNDELR